MRLLVLLLAPALLGGCSVASLFGGVVLCTTDEACASDERCLESRCQPVRVVVSEGEGEGEEGEGEEGEGEEGEGSAGTEGRSGCGCRSVDKAEVAS